MSTFLLVISFILHVISFLIIILLYFRIEKMRDIERKQASIMKDMEDVLSSYILEMKEENEKFLLEVQGNVDKSKMVTKKSPNDKPKKTAPKQRGVPAKIDTVEDQLTDEDLMQLLPTFNEDKELKTKDQNKLNNRDINKPTIEKEPKKEEKMVKEESKEPPFESLPIGTQVKILSEEGLSVEEIAKKLSKGRTEIELFLKFNS